MAMKFCGWLQFGVRPAYFATICRSCLFCQDQVKNLTIASFAFIIQFNPLLAEKKMNKTFKYMIKT